MRTVIGFRLRLALFFVGMLVAVQLITGAIVYGVTRHALVVDGERQLAASAKAFTAQMDDVSARIAGNVGVMALDFALRQAIAEGDRGTVLSVLHNHGRRVGASRMQLINLDGTIAADTADAHADGKSFAFSELIQRAFYQQTAVMAAVQGHVYWIVVVPIYAPQPVGLIVVYVQVDDELLAHMQELSNLRRDVALEVQLTPSQWQAVAQGDRSTPFARGLEHATGDFPTEPGLRRIAQSDYIVLAQPLQHPYHSPAVVVVFGYSLDDALRPYHHLAVAWLALLALGLAAGLLGVWLIARNVSRPVEWLATVAKRIEEGDYRVPPRLPRRDEIGALANAISTMAAAVQQREERISHQATHDAVTGLPNRVAIEAEITRDMEAGVTRGSLLMIGLTRVPDIIKTMGHGLCDRLMRDAGERIQRVVDGAQVARATDSNFVAWLPSAGRDDAVQAAIRILDALATPYTEPDISIDMVPAIGIAIYPEHAAEAVALLRYAETAQFAAAGSSRAWAFYQTAIDPHRPERLSLMGELREALARGQLELHYQPKLALATRCLDGAEALVRWQHPLRGAIPPDVFIGMAEDTGNIQRLTRWALEAAITQASQWQAQGMPLRVAVNLSARDLADADLPHYIVGLAAMHRLPPQQLTLEITERAVIGEFESASRVLQQLAARGFHIAIDDFGVGQSSLSYLHTLPVDELKIDQSFIKPLIDDPNDRIIVRSIVELSHELGYQVTAEGVEDEATLDYLASIGCDHAQGYFVARPMRADALTPLITTQGHNSHA
ncbi:putative bifunctional diguanylate cyclase/phosphodiesterase [Dyella sp.]|uniref:putative bifunctional diguanylate cyclase/phosphodiesterase n=1 Tax=Dyella sp. TaxID=1869338 RepID=UPI002B46BB8C|nr:EAL domain-containing protein [Dyella sp.]HKT27609.1 EAL domain-containing protein [Dyella sp.]